jgi:hypothetical protein
MIRKEQKNKINSHVKGIIECNDLEKVDVRGKQHCKQIVNKQQKQND